MEINKIFHKIEKLYLQYAQGNEDIYTNNLSNIIAALPELVQDMDPATATFTAVKSFALFLKICRNLNTYLPKVHQFKNDGETSDGAKSFNVALQKLQNSPHFDQLNNSFKKIPPFSYPVEQLTIKLRMM